MKAHLDIKHDGNLSVEGRTTMTFDENSIAHLMSILTDLYSDPELAVIREYSTNAWDSHRAAGIPDPIKVTLPSSLNPIFTVADHGTGMSLDDILNFFAKYGASSKRETDDEVGMLGLGCKSALTYTSQFTLVSIKGGVKVTVLVTRLESGADAVQVMDTTTTDERNGVTVQIPVRNVESFCRRARDFYSYWDEGTVELDGIIHPTVWENPKNIQLDPDVMLVAGGKYNGTSHIVMGNIPYPVDNYKAGYLIDSEGLSVVVRVPIGSINFTPSREALQYTKRTQDVIKTIQEYVEASVLIRAQADINACATHFDALVRANEWRKAHRGMFKLEYRGQVVPMSFTVDGQRTYRWDVGRWEEEPSTKVNSISIEEAIEQWHVVNFGAPYVTKLTKRRLKIHHRALLNAGVDIDTRIHYFHRGSFGGVWLEGRPNIYEAKDFAHIEVPGIEKDRSYQRAKGKYRLLKGESTYDWTDTIPPNAVWCFTTEAEGRRQNAGHHANTLGKVLVAIPKKDLAKFQQAHPKVKHIATVVADECRKFVASLDKYQRFAFHDKNSIRDSGILELKGHSIFDPELRAILDLARRIPDRLSVQNKHNDLVHMARPWGKYVPDIPRVPEIEERIWAAVKPYPILTHGRVDSYGRYGSRNGDINAQKKGEIMVEIVNALYLARNNMHLNPLNY